MNDKIDNETGSTNSLQTEKLTSQSPLTVSNNAVHLQSSPNRDLSDACSNPLAALSKKQLKRLKKKEAWLANLPAKRAKEKLKMKLKRQVARQNNISLGPTRKELKSVKMSTSSCKLRLALDFSFDDLMEQRDLAKCIKQVQRCYCINRRVLNPVQFHIVNLNGRSRAEISKVSGYENWDVRIHDQPYLQLFPKEEIVYLTSESENVVETLDQTKVYIIGALVDHNSQKGLCLRIAEEQGIAHCQLPIGEHLDMKSRKVLTINHVFETILRVCNGATWKDALLAVLPQRKGAVPKQVDESVANPN